MTQSNQRCVTYVSINALVAYNAHNTSITFTEFLCERPKCELIDPRADLASKVRRNMRYRAIATLCLFGIASLVALKYPFLGLGICCFCLVGSLRPGAPGAYRSRCHRVPKIRVRHEPEFLGRLRAHFGVIYTSVPCLDLPQNRLLRFLPTVLLSRLLQLESDPKVCFPKEYRLKAM